MENTLKCIAGDDGYLRYYYECQVCGTIVIEDQSESYCIKKYNCPVCNPDQKNFPFEYITKDKRDDYKVPFPITLVPKIAEYEQGLFVVDEIPIVKRSEISLEERLKMGLY